MCLTACVWLELVSGWRPSGDSGIPEPSGPAQGTGKSFGERGRECSFSGPVTGQPLHPLLESGVVLHSPWPPQQSAAAGAGISTSFTDFTGTRDTYTVHPDSIRSAPLFPLYPMLLRYSQID